MSEIIRQYFCYRQNLFGPIFVVFRALYEKPENPRRSYHFIAEQIYDERLGKWIHRGDRVAKAHYLGDTDLDQISEAEAREYLVFVPNRREQLTARAVSVSDKKAFILEVPIDKWAPATASQPYIQTVRDVDESWMLEICSNKYLDIKLDASQIKAIRKLGFNNPVLKENKPNFWKELSPVTTAENIADEMLLVLQEVFQIGEVDTIDTPFPVPDWFEPWEKLAE
jgi:hypothetical protein